MQVSGVKRKYLPSINTNTMRHQHGSGREQAAAIRQMRIARRALLPGALGVVLTCGAGCPAPPQARKAPPASSARDLQRLSGLKLPASAKVLSDEGESAHDGTKFRKWIVALMARPKLPGGVLDVDDSRSFVASLQKEVAGQSIGSPAGAKYQSSLWNNKSGQWQAAFVQTERGFFLSVENIVLG